MSTQLTPSLCDSCSRAHPVVQKDVFDINPKRTCQAFPGGIPDGIRFRGEDHRLPVPGDHGLQYETAEGLEDFFDNWVATKGHDSEDSD